MNAPKEIDIKMRTEGDGSVYVWVPDIGLTVKGSSEEDALAKTERAVRHIMNSSKLSHLL